MSPRDWGKTLNYLQMKVAVGMEEYLLDALANDNEVNEGGGSGWVTGVKGLDPSQRLLIWNWKLRSEWIHLMWLRIQNPFFLSRLLSFSPHFTLHKALWNSDFLSDSTATAADESQMKKLLQRRGKWKATKRRKKWEIREINFACLNHIFLLCCFKSSSMFVQPPPPRQNVRCLKGFPLKSEQSEIFKRLKRLVWLSDW